MLSAYPARQRTSSLHGYAVLGAITAAQAADQVFPQSQIRSTAGFRQADWNNIENAASSGSFQSFNPSGCSGVSAGGNIKIIQQGSGLALTGVSMGLTAAGAVTAATLAPFTLGISAIIGLFPLFFSHHAAAVAKEQRIVCAAVPAAQNYLSQIYAAVQAGTVSPQQGISALQSLLSDFTSEVSSIMKNSSSACNAACIWVKQLTAIVAFVSSQYQDLAAAQAAAAPVTSSSGPVSSTAVTSGSTLQIPQVAPIAAVPATAPATALPSWTGIAALVIAGVVLAKVL